jgi:PRTRC genetic system protein E
MNFFKQLSEIGVQNLELKVTIKDDTLSVMIIPEIKNISAIPLTVVGTAEELDEGFFGIISAPLKKTVGLVSNVEEFEKSVENKAATKSDSGTAEDKEPTPKAKAATKKKTPPYKHQKYLDAILAIVDAEGYILTEENKEELSEATSKLLVMDSKNEVALEWEQKIKDLSLEPNEEITIVEEKDEPVKEVVPEPKSEPVVEVKVEEPVVEEKKVVTPPAPPTDEETSSDEEEINFDDDDLDLDFEDFFTS